MPSVVNVMRTFEDIHDEIERLSEERTELWHRLSAGTIRTSGRRSTHSTRGSTACGTSSVRSVPDCASAIARRSSPAPASKSGSSARPEPPKHARIPGWLFTGLARGVSSAGRAPGCNQELTGSIPVRSIADRRRLPPAAAKPHFDGDRRAGHAGPLRARSRRGRGDEADAARTRAARRRGELEQRARRRRPAGAPAIGRAGRDLPRPDRTRSPPRRSRRREARPSKRCRSSHWPTPSGRGSTSASRRSARSSGSSPAFACSSTRRGAAAPARLRLGAAAGEPRSRDRAAGSDAAPAAADRARSRAGGQREAPAQQHARRPAAEKRLKPNRDLLVSSAMGSSATA